MRSKVMMFLMTLFACAAFAESVNSEIQKEFDLPAPLLRQIQEWNPGFQAYSRKDFPDAVRELYGDKKDELPMAAKADFNGDGRADYAFFGKDGKNSFVIFVANMPKKYVVVVAEKTELMDPKKMSVASGDATQPGLPKYIGIAENDEIGDSGIQKNAKVLFFETYGGSNELFQLKGAELFKVVDKP